MKTRRLSLFFAFAAALVAVFSVWAGFRPSKTAVAAERTEYEFYDFALTDYDVYMDVGENRVIRVEERIVADLSYGKHGIIRDLPLDMGVRYTDFRVSVDGVSVPNEFHTDDSMLLSLYMNSGKLLPAGEHTFFLAYTMTVPVMKSDKNLLRLDVLGEDWQAPVYHFTATIACPAEPVSCAYSALGLELSQKDNTVTVERETGFMQGITLDLLFQNGVLKAPPPDLTPLWATLVALGVVGIALLAKVLFCRQPDLVIPVGLEAPDEMDPLRMGRIIDNKVDAEDLGSLVFYLAAKGYLTIDLKDEDDPYLEPTGKELPPDAPRHLHLFYNGLFENRGGVHTSTLTNTFYPTAAMVTKSVSEADGALFRPKGNVFVLLFAALSVLALGLFSLLWAKAAVGGSYLFWGTFPLALLSYAFSAFGSLYSARIVFKKGKTKSVLALVGFFLLSLVPALFAFFGRCAAFSPWTVVMSSVGASLVGLCAGLFSVRTERYNTLLGKVLGFQQFIRYTEKDRIAFMVKDDPELYYKILPYAQVCGVTDVWTEKFEGLNSPPPAWLTCHTGLVDFFVWNSVFRSMNSSISHSFVSRPSNRGGGFGGGGFGGGSVGGGFGGGGGRSF